MQHVQEIKLYDADTIEYAGSIIIKDGEWEYRDVNHEDMISVTKGMPLKAVLSNLIMFNFVYDIVENKP